MDYGLCKPIHPFSVLQTFFQPSTCAPKSLFPQSCVSSGGSIVGLMVTSSKRAYAIPRSAAPRNPIPVAVHCWPVPPQETLKHSSVSDSGPWCVQGLFEPSECCWSVWGLILNAIPPLLPPCWGFSLPLDTVYLLKVAPAPSSHVLESRLVWYIKMMEK